MKPYHTILKNKLAEFFPFIHSTELVDFVNLWTVHKQLNKFDYLLTCGQVERNLYFILQGTFHEFYPLENNFTASLATTNRFYNSFESFVTQEPSKVSIQALSKSVVIGISREIFYKSIYTNWNYERAFRLNTEAQLIERYERDFLLKLPAAKRVMHYLKTKPRYFQDIPQKYIASFLNLTPETFSRILNKVKA